MLIKYQITHPKLKTLKSVGKSVANSSKFINKTNKEVIKTKLTFVDSLKNKDNHQKWEQLLMKL